MFPSEGKAPLKNPVTPLGIDPGTVRLVAQGLNHYATPHHSIGGGGTKTKTWYFTALITASSLYDEQSDITK